MIKRGEVKEGVFVDDAECVMASDSCDMVPVSVLGEKR